MCMQKYAFAFAEQIVNYLIILLNMSSCLKNEQG